MAKKSSKSSDSNKMLTELNSERKSLLNFRFQKATGQLEKTSQIKKSRKKISDLVVKINESRDL